MSTRQKISIAVVWLSFLMSWATGIPAEEWTKNLKEPGSEITNQREARNTVAVEGPIQYCIIPYAVTGGNWSSTLSVHNMGSTRVFYLITYLPADGSEAEEAIFSVPGYGLKADSLTGFRGDPPPEGVISIQLRTLNENTPFAATLIIGSDKEFKGFGVTPFFSKQTTSILIDDPIIVGPLME